MAIRVKPFRTKVVFNINYHKFSKIQAIPKTNHKWSFSNIKIWYTK